MKNYLLKFQENRVRRNYLGGAAIDMLRKKGTLADGDRPEDWIASTVPAKNPGLPPIKNEGLSFVLDAENHLRLFTDVLRNHPAFYLGQAHYENLGCNIGFLAKILDSAIRLHVQVHPTKEYAKAHLGSDFGKFEAYYIVGVRPGFDPYIRLGFQHAPTLASWKQIVTNQDINKMDACFEKIPVKPGEVWFVPGGLPHAIGAGIVMVEVMEPTDLVIRCEFTREGIVVPEDARFMGQDIDFALPMFDYTAYSALDVKKRFCVTPKVLENFDRGLLEGLMDKSISGSFELQKFTAHGDTEMQQDGRFHVGILLKGQVTLKAHGDTITLKPGDSYFAASACEKIHYIIQEETEFIFAKP
jgi:mannose-6-phosphate isomerase